MSHVAPHRWHDAWAGKLAEAEVAAMGRHADGCPKCARAKERVERASNSFTAIRSQQAPELPWDTVRAKVHWSVSTARHEKLRAGWRMRGGAILGWGALAAGLVLGVASGSLPQASEPSAPIATTVASAPAPLSGLVSRLSGQVMIDGVRRGDAFERVLGPGSQLATADGRVDVQFGDASAFSLGPASSIQLRRFDVSSIELVVEGTVDIQVAPRASGQRFVVIAGAQTIEVRGTQFRVEHEGASTKVACHHGLVAVRDAHGQVDVPTAKKLDVSTHVTDAQVASLSKDELAQLAVATPHTIALRWTDAETLAKNTAPLEISTDDRRSVRVDGIEIGEAPVRVRVVPGRHTVEAIDNAGRFRRAGWVDIAPGATSPARLEVLPPDDDTPAPVTSGAQIRKRQLHAGLSVAKLRACTRTLAKSNLTDTFVRIEIGVDETGAVSFLNIIDSDLPSTTQSCVRDALLDVGFGRGPAATWREKLDL